MKRILPLIFSFILTACGITAYLWQTEIPDFIYDANIDKIGENRYYISKLNKTHLSFYELDLEGGLRPLSEIPSGNASGITLKWMDDQSYFTNGMHGIIAFGTLAEGIRWQLNENAFYSAAGREVHLNSRNLLLSPHGTAFLYGAGFVYDDAGHRDQFAYFSEIDSQGNILEWKMDSKMRDVEVRQALTNGYVVQWELDDDESKKTGYAKFLQIFDQQRTSLFERHLIGYQNFKLALDDRLFIADRIDNIDSVTVYSWSNEPLYTFPVSSKWFASYGKMQLTKQNELFLNTYYHAEKRTLNGELVWYYEHNLQQEPGDLYQSLDDGSNVIARNKIEISYAGATLEVKTANDGSIFFRGYGGFKDDRKIEFHVFEPQKGKKKLIKQKGDSTTYTIDYCDTWCNQEPVESEVGICRIEDMELLENGGLITLGNYCDMDIPEKLVITRY